MNNAVNNAINQQKHVISNRLRQLISRLLQLITWRSKETNLQIWMLIWSIVWWGGVWGECVCGGRQTTNAWNRTLLRVSHRGWYIKYGHFHGSLGSANYGMQWSSRNALEAFDISIGFSRVQCNRMKQQVKKTSSLLCLRCVHVVQVHPSDHME